MNQGTPAGRLSHLRRRDVRKRTLSAALWSCTAAASVIVMTAAAMDDDGRRRIAALFEAGEPAVTAKVGPTDAIADLYAEVSRIRSETRMLTLEKEAIATKLAALESQAGPFTASISPEATTGETAPRSVYPPMPVAPEGRNGVETTFTDFPPEALAEAEPLPRDEDGIARDLAALAAPEARRTETTVNATHFAIELAEASSLEDIRAAWKRLSAEAPATTDSLTPGIVMDEGSGGELHLRLIAGPFPDAAEAMRACTAMESRELACKPVSDRGMRLVMQ